MNKKTIFFNLIKFEIKNQLKSILFWIFIILSICLSCLDIGLFKLPVFSDKDAYNILFDGHKNRQITSIYHLPLNDIYGKYYSSKPVNKTEINTYEEWAKINSNKENSTQIMDDVNNRLKNCLGEYRFSQIFFKIFSACCVGDPKYILMIIFPLIWSKDRSSKMLEMVKIKPINQSGYLLSKFIGCFLPYISIIFLLFLGVGIFEKIRLWQTDFKFALYDMIIPFFVFTIPPLLFVAIFLSFFSLIFKHPLLSGPIYLLLYTVLPQTIFGFPKCIWSVEAITGFTEDIVFIPPIYINYGLWHQIVWLVMSLLLFYASCYYWNKKE